MNKPDFDNYLNDSLASLDKEIEPNKVLWSGVEHAIVNTSSDSENKATWPKLTAMAACIIASVLTFNVLVLNENTNDVIAMNDYFSKQKSTLLVQYKGQDALTDNWQIQLQELEQAAQAINKALENEPHNQALLTMLAQVYQQQLDLINKVHAPRWQHI
ncbi:hypothetical protein J8L70_02700 [Pseudoalteromonas sp. MMG010]|uniref:hypothetical protein n=1 Tax=Pseudoalteromonas sp. MMG010 TaxID=2822685 RepID=UPI001B3A3F7E|nr:hypothetical protein [Pseudoalteromonas sp. MMG010]MBQ4832141.1 hypothetical protein [Pseudoalteromonas sp. MMG010]